MIKRLLTTILILFFAVPLFAATHNVTNDSELTTANSNAVAGDNVSLAAGTYGVAINPSNSGTSGNPIVYTAASGATATISGVTRCVALNSGQDYITVQKGDGTALVLDDPGDYYIHATNNTGIIIDGLTNSAPELTDAYYPFYFDGVTDLELKNNNWTFAGVSGTTTSPKDLVGVSACSKVKIHSNTLGDALHTSLTIRGSTQYFHIYNNTFTNSWKHVLGVQNGSLDGLVELNTFREVGDDQNNNPNTDSRNGPAASIEHTMDGIVYRFNLFDQVDQIEQPYNTGAITVELNQGYHNTIYNPLDQDSNWQCGNALSANIYGTVQHNRWMNNIWYLAEGGYDSNFADQGGTFANNQIKNNIIIRGSGNVAMKVMGTLYTSITALEAAQGQYSGNIQDDPLLAAPDSDNFTLQFGSPAIDAAAWLATISGVSGNQLTLGTNEAYAFVGTLNGIRTADTVYDDDGSSSVLVSVDAHNKITLTDATGFIATDTLTVVNYSDSGPDIGANEYSVPVPPVDPSQDVKAKNIGGAMVGGTIM